MKTPLYPLLGGLADAGGIEPREPRDVELRSADAKPDLTDHTQTACSEVETLASIERALHRLATDTYGQCVSCGADIKLERLEQNPAVETCDLCCEKSGFKAH